MFMKVREALERVDCLPLSHIWITLVAAFHERSGPTTECSQLHARRYAQFLFQERIISPTLELRGTDTVEGQLGAQQSFL